MLRKIYVISKFTVIEAVRKKIFYSLILFLILLFIFTSQSKSFVEIDSQYKLTLTWVTRLISIVAIVSVFLLTAQSIPEFYEHKYSFLLFTKPLTKFDFLIGKFVGYVIVSLLLIISMCIISYVFIYLKHGRQFFDHFLAFKIVEHDEFEFRNSNGGTNEKIGTTTQPLVLTLSDEGIKSARWVWFDLPPSDTPRYLMLKFRLYRGPRDAGRVILTLTNTLLDKTKREVLKCFSLKNYIIEIPLELTQEGGTIIAQIDRGDSTTTLQLWPGSVLLADGNHSFHLNFLLHLIGELLKVLLIFAPVLVIANFVSTPTAIVFGLVFIVCSSMINQTVEYSKTVEEELKERPIKLYLKKGGHDVIHVPVWLAKFSVVVIKLAKNVLPDFNKFNSFRDLLESKYITFSRSLSLLTNAAIYAFVWLIFGCFCFQIIPKTC